MKYLVLQTHDIGDVMLSTALCNALKQAYPDSQVDMMTMAHCAGVVEGNPNVDEIIVLQKSERNKPTYMIKFLLSIRARKYDAIVNVQGQIVGLLTSLFSLSARRVGENKFPWRLASSDQVALPGTNPPSGDCSAIDVRFSLLAPLLDNVSDRSYKIWLSAQEIEFGSQLLLAAGVDITRPVVALGVNSRDDYKQWPIHYFADLAAWLIDSFGVQIYVFFGPGEETYSKQLRPLLTQSQQQYVFDDIHTASIRELAQVFSHCSLYLGNDTGPRHISQSLDVPAFAVVSPASNKWGWVPWNNPRFQAVDVGDAVGMSDAEWLDIRSALTAGVDDQEWFLKLEPDYVKQQLAQMIEQLNLFEDGLKPGH